MLLLAARGKNYSFYRAGEVVLCRVFQRKELTSVEGAQCADEISRTAQKLVVDSCARYFIFDIRHGPPVFGPKTEAALGALFAHLAKIHVGIRCLVSDNPLQEMQYGRLLRDVAPRRHEVVKTFALACDSAHTTRGLHEPPPEA